MLAAKLEEGLRNMLEQGGVDPRRTRAATPTVPSSTPAPTDPRTGLVEELYAHPLLDSLRRNRRVDIARWGRSSVWKAGRLPSYISPRAFSLALLDTLAPQEGEAGFHAVRREVERVEPKAVRDRLLLLLDEADGDLNAFRHNVEAWFDDTMARVSGWYKRQAQLILLVIALGLTVCLNVNTIAIADRLWADSSVRAAVVGAAQSPAVTGELSGTTAQQKLQNAADGIDDLGIPLGYTGSPWDEIDLKTGLGWLITIAGLSLGAPFWFDALSRLSRLRGTGKPEIPLPASDRGAANERVKGGL